MVGNQAPQNKARGTQIATKGTTKSFFMCHIGKAGGAWRICHANTHMLQVVQVPNIGLAGQCLAAGGPCRAPEVFGGPTQLEALNPHAASCLAKGGWGHIILCGIFQYNTVCGIIRYQKFNASIFAFLD